MEYFGLDEAVQARRYAFKCHRTTDPAVDGDVIYPVNALAFHPTLGTFATGGGDGSVCMWDGANKKRLLQVSGFPTSIASLAFNASGTTLAIAASYTFEKGDIDHPADAIYIRNMDSAEVTPRVKAAAQA